MPDRLIIQKKEGKMNYSEIIVEIENFIGKITLNRPNELNTFNTQLAIELNNALLEFDKNDQVRVILLKGAGKHFCAGIDLNEFAGKNVVEYKEWIEQMEQPLVTMSKIKKPVVAQVQGVAAANGAGLVAAADLAIFSDRAKVGLTAINVGLNCIGPVVPVSKSVGRKKALELLLFGDLIKADEALRIGLINRVVPDADLENETLAWVEKLAQKSPIALQIAKSSFYASENLDYEKSFKYMNEAFASLCTTEDANEGIKAFKAKRKPSWKLK